jgi:hypothetical protein
MGELGLDRFLHESPLGLGSEQLAVEIGLRPDPTSGLHFAPGGAEARLGVGVTRRPIVRSHFLELALGQNQLVPLHSQFAIQHRHALAMAHGKALGDGDGLGIRHLGRQPASSLGVSQLLPLGRELAFGDGEALLHPLEPEFCLHQGFAQRQGAGAGIGALLREEPVEPGA